MQKPLRLIAALALLLLAGCAQGSFSHEISIVRAGESPGFSPQTQHLTGTSGRIRVTNTLTDDHGFSIEGLRAQKVIKAGETVTVRLANLRPIDYEIFCQLHDEKTGKGAHARALMRVAR